MLSGQTPPRDSMMELGVVRAMYKEGAPDLDTSVWRNRLVMVARAHSAVVVTMNSDRLKRAGEAGLNLPFPVVLVEAITDAIGPQGCAVLDAMEQGR